MLVLVAAAVTEQKKLVILQKSCTVYCEFTVVSKFSYSFSSLRQGKKSSGKVETQS
jgi:hypothetical protein